MARGTVLHAWSRHLPNVSNAWSLIDIKLLFSFDPTNTFGSNSNAARLRALLKRLTAKRSTLAFASCIIISLGLFLSLRAYTPRLLIGVSPTYSTLNLPI